jgi:hypothetical protein
MNDRTMAQNLALLFGAAFLLVAILGFIPGITSDAPGDFAGDESEAELLGLFQVSVLHNLVHLAFGIGILAARKHSTALQYLLWGGIAYLGVFVLGLVGALDWLPADDADDWLHLVLGAALVGGWYLSRNESGRAAVRTT